MQIPTKGKVIEKIKKDWSMNGRSGTTHRARILVDTEIFNIKFNDEQLDIYNRLPEKGDVELTLSLTSPKEELLLRILEVKK